MNIVPIVDYITGLCTNTVDTIIKDPGHSEQFNTIDNRLRQSAIFVYVKVSKFEIKRLFFSTF